MDTEPNRPDDLPTNGDSGQNPRGVFGRLARSLIPENSPIPKLSADAWKTVIIRAFGLGEKYIKRVSPNGLVIVSVTLIICGTIALVVKILSQ